MSKLAETVEILAIDNSGLIDAVRFDVNTLGVKFHSKFEASITKLYIQEEFNEINALEIYFMDLLKHVFPVNYGEILLKPINAIVIFKSKL